PRFVPEILRVPPGDDRSDVQLLRPHEQLDVRHEPMHVQVARPPAFGPKFEQALDLEAKLGGLAPNFQRAFDARVFRPAFDLDGVFARLKFELYAAGADEVVEPVRQSRSALRLAG